ncbi:MAG: hypothetical protein LBK29_02450 [Oscillospiraceae bacterium]|jgi:hypothetical protein|nr:hypothetical protein [Oscillospiraceae bacterium]
MSFLKKAFSLACVLACFSGFISNWVSAFEVFEVIARRNPSDEYELLYDKGSSPSNSELNEIFGQLTTLYSGRGSGVQSKSPFGFVNNVPSWFPSRELSKVITGMEGCEEDGFFLRKENGDLIFVTFSTTPESFGVCWDFGGSKKLFLTFTEEEATEGRTLYELGDLASGTPWKDPSIDAGSEILVKLEPFMKEPSKSCPISFDRDVIFRLNYNGRPYLFPNVVRVFIKVHEITQPQKENFIGRMKKEVIGILGWPEWLNYLVSGVLPTQ